MKNKSKYEQQQKISQIKTGTLDAAIATGQHLDEEESDDEGNKAQPFDIEKITRQRIADNLFDDVIRKADTRPTTLKKDGKNGEEEEVLNFAKSRVGLGDIYAQQYEEEVFGQASKQEEKVSKEKQICKELFGKVDLYTFFYTSIMTSIMGVS